MNLDLSSIPARGRTLRAWLLNGCCLVLLVSCGDPEPYRIGFVGGLSGQRLVSNGVEAIVGHMTSAMSMATLDIVNDQQVVMVSPTTTTDKLTGLDDYFFRVVDNTRTYATRNATYQYQKLGVARIAAALDTRNRAYVESWYEHFRTAFEAEGGAILRKIEFESSPKVDFRAIVMDLLETSPDGILLLSNSLDAALLCQQIRNLDPDVHLSASEWAATERLIELGGRAVEQILIAQFLDRDSQDPGYRRFRKDFIARFSHEPGFAGVAGYDAANVVLTALERAAGQDLKQAILEIGSFRGGQGQLSIDRFGDSSRTMVLTTVEDGRFKVLRY
jgi:branched-chain amino acid transport system substrate-binding protein